jgi:hypothetical protein
VGEPLTVNVTEVVLASVNVTGAPSVAVPVGPPESATEPEPTTERVYVPAARLLACVAGAVGLSV